MPDAGFPATSKNASLNQRTTYARDFAKWRAARHRILKKRLTTPASASANAWVAGVAPRRALTPCEALKWHSGLDSTFSPRVPRHDHARIRRIREAKA